jgi:hypothetical protein
MVWISRVAGHFAQTEPQASWVIGLSWREQQELKRGARLGQLPGSTPARQ